MKYSKQIITGLLGALLAFSSISFADIKKIDHSPEQLNRARSQFDQLASVLLPHYLYMIMLLTAKQS